LIAVKQEFNSFKIQKSLQLQALHKDWQKIKSEKNSSFSEFSSCHVSDYYNCMPMVAMGGQCQCKQEVAALCTQGPVQEIFILKPVFSHV